MPENKKRDLHAIKETHHEVLHGETIGKLVSSRYYVEQDELVEDLLYELSRNPDITEVAVVNSDREIEGMVVRKDFLELLGKPCNRDIYQSKKVKKVMTLAGVYDIRMNILSLVDEIHETLGQPGITHFLVRQHKKKFYGILTNRDLLFYLSDITRKDIQLTQELQHRLVREFSDEKKAGIELAGTSAASKGIGGDCYQFLQYAPSNWVLSLCDVSGKGLSASLVTTLLRGTTELFDFNQGMGKYLLRLNQFLINSFDDNQKIPGVFIELNTATGEASLFEMGHGYAYLFRKGKLQQLCGQLSNLPLGVDAVQTIQCTRFRMEKNDLLVLFTDGVLEQTDDEQEKFGLKRLERLLDEHSDVSCKKICRKIHEKLDDFKKGWPCNDAIALLLARLL